MQVPSINSATGLSTRSAAPPFLEISAGGRNRSVAMKRKEEKVNVDDESGGIGTGKMRGRRAHQEGVPSAPMIVLHLGMRTTGVTTEVTTRQDVAADGIHIPAVGGRNQCRLLQVTAVLLHQEEAAVDHEMSQCTTRSREVPGEDRDARLPRSTRVQPYDHRLLQHFLFKLPSLTTLPPSALRFAKWFEELLGGL